MKQRGSHRSRPALNGSANEPIVIQPNIGLDAAARQAVITLLQQIQVDETVLLAETRLGAQHALTGGSPALHALYEAQSQQMQAARLEIAERIGILGGAGSGANGGENSGEKNLAPARLEAERGAGPDIVSLLADHEAFIRFLRDDTQKCFEMYDDQGSYVLLVSILRMHEKMAWLLRSNLIGGPLD